MKVIVAVIVYDRFKHIQEWIRCWKMCNTQDSELIIIHNFKDEEDKIKYKEFCDVNNIVYICRNNIGMDIGALQDVCRDRLEGFPKDWDYLLWACDDTIPMSKDFISHYLREIETPNIGIVALELSREVKLHVRTTAFMMSREIANKLIFPADPVTTKNHCYEFEHRSRNALYEQITRMGKKAVQVYPNFKKSYLWDVHVRGYLDRWDEYHTVFPNQKTE